MKRYYVLIFQMANYCLSKSWYSWNIIGYIIRGYNQYLIHDFFAVSTKKVHWNRMNVCVEKTLLLTSSWWIVAKFLAKVINCKSHQVSARKHCANDVCIVYYQLTSQPFEDYTLRIFIVNFLAYGKAGHLLVKAFRDLELILMLAQYVHLQANWYLLNWRTKLQRNLRNAWYVIS